MPKSIQEHWSWLNRAVCICCGTLCFWHKVTAWEPTMLNSLWKIQPPRLCPEIVRDKAISSKTKYARGLYNRVVGFGAVFQGPGVLQSSVWCIIKGTDCGASPKVPFKSVLWCEKDLLPKKLVFVKELRYVELHPLCIFFSSICFFFSMT